MKAMKRPPYHILTPTLALTFKEAKTVTLHAFLEKNAMSGRISIVRKLNVSSIIISPQLIPFEEG